MYSCPYPPEEKSPTLPRKTTHSCSYPPEEIPHPSNTRKTMYSLYPNEGRFLTHSPQEKPCTVAHTHLKGDPHPFITRKTMYSCPYLHGERSLTLLAHGKLCTVAHTHLKIETGIDPYFRYRHGQEWQQSSPQSQKPCSPSHAICKSKKIFSRCLTLSCDDVLSN